MSLRPATILLATLILIGPTVHLRAAEVDPHPELTGPRLQVLPSPQAIPPFELTTVSDGEDRVQDCFNAYPTIFIVADLSTQAGWDDLFHWMQFFHDILHQPSIVMPPWVLGIGIDQSHPGPLTVAARTEQLRVRWQQAGLFGGPLWAGVAFDSQNQFLDGLGIEHINDTQCYLSDQNGQLRLAGRGGLEDLDQDQMLAMLDQIRDAWGMSPGEVAMARILIFGWQAQLQRSMLTQPLPIPENSPAVPPPPAYAHELR